MVEECEDTAFPIFRPIFETARWLAVLKATFCPFTVLLVVLPFVNDMSCVSLDIERLIYII